MVHGLGTRLRVGIAALSFAAAFACAAAANAAPGDLDPSFGRGGTLESWASKGGTVAVTAVATQPDGRILLAGSNQGRVFVNRLLENGDLDPSFPAWRWGPWLPPAPEIYGRPTAIAVQPDGKIVVAGGNGDFLFLRFDADGQLDPSFGGGDGVEEVPVGTAEDKALSVAIGPGGRIVAAGIGGFPPYTQTAGVVVLGPDGAPDPGYFGGDGMITVTTPAGGGDNGEAVAMLADGRVLVADGNGMFTGAGFALVRLLVDGAFDPSFGGGDGLVQVSTPGAGEGDMPNGRVADLAMLPDDRILASGYGFRPGGPPFDQVAAVARFLADGRLDRSFGSGGFFIDSRGLTDTAQRVMVAPSGKIVIAGGWYPQLEPLLTEQTALARLGPQGQLDTGFGRGGMAFGAPVAITEEIFRDADLDSQGRTVTVSRASIGGGAYEHVVRRFLGGELARGNRAPHAWMRKVPRSAAASRLRVFAGGARDPDGRIARVQVALRKRGPRGYRPAKGRLHWQIAKGKAEWRFELKRDLRPGRYVVYARAVDSAGLGDSSFSRARGNRYAFRVLR